METKEYQLEPNPRQVDALSAQDDLYLSVKIGNGQIGGTNVKSGDQLLAKGDLSEAKHLGTSSDLKDQEIDIITNVLDVNSFTNDCVITTTFLNQNNQVLFTKIDKGAAPENGIARFTGKYLIKILAVVFLFFMAFQPNLKAQNDFSSLKFQDLETPSSPGFILLDKAPSSIERPTTPQGVGLSLLSLEKGGGALEFAPFWLTTHPNLKAEKMYKNQFPILYNFSVSVANVKTDSTGYYAFGVRTRLFQSFGKTTQKLDAVRNKLISELSGGNEIDIKKIENLRKKYADLMQKPIFTIDFAMAFGAGSATNSFKDLKLSRWAAWLSFNWRPKGDNFYFTVLTRYMENSDFGTYTSNSSLGDLGTRLNYDINKFCLSMEYLQRIDFTQHNNGDYRLACVGSYKISNSIYATATFGKNFSSVDNIIALAGINFGFSRSKIKAF